ncbi:energy transducer TonB [Ulvibacter antarcticus]|uniref:Protein TonB n=1 Tax=Ulvibacter antarcticus TaxID=442714 RepID=A0A3L9YZD7_9FLAO|nr:energy transducer TonB [Ulvibacter antarcticus]RMA65684.1 protein TonB [Ulvibacter antarcticus]
MIPSKQSLNGNQPETLSTRVDKKRVNIPWNHRLFFQLGLIVSLLATFFIMESSIGYVSPKAVPDYSEAPDDPYYFPDVVVEVPQPEQKEIAKVEVPKVKTRIADVIKVASNDAPVIDTPVASTDIPKPAKPVIVKTPEVPVKNTGPENINSVEFVPVFPGCESMTTKSDKIACMSSKIGAFIQKKFNTDEFNYLDPNMVQKIYVQFKINTEGDIVDIKARSSDAALEKEGMRVISKLPRMEPGRQGSTKVEVMYMVPIAFKVD